MIRRRATAAIAGALVVVACKGNDGKATSNDDVHLPSPQEVLAEKPLSFPTSPLKVGDTVYDFTALAHNGQALRLSEFLSRPVVVYFCSQDKAPVCTALATSIRDPWMDLHAQVDMVFAVSPEPTIVHAEFASEHKLTHLFLSDTDLTIHRVFGVQPGTVVSYLIGTDRVIRQVFLPPAANHGVEILNALTTLGLRGPDFPI